MKRKLIFLILVFIVLIVGVFIFSNRSQEVDNGFYLDGKIIETEDYMIKDGKDYYISYVILDDYDLIDSFNDIDSQYIQIFHNNSLYEINYRENSKTYTIKEDRIYLNSNYIKDKIDYNIDIYEEGELIFFDNNVKTAKTIKNGKIKYDKSKLSKVITKCQKEEMLTVYKYEDNWALVRKEQFLGYMPLKNIKSIDTINEFDIKELSHSKNIILAWDLFNRKADEILNYVYYDELSAIAPTWHSLNEDTIFTDWYLQEYKDFYTNKNVKFWGVFNNSFDKELTSKFLRDINKRKLMIKEIIKISNIYNYDGVNLDFENLYYEDKDYLTAFIKELYIETKKNNLVFSVDITAISKSQNWSLIYDRKEISKYVDYLILMAYDATTSPEQGIGPIASITWVEKSIKELKEISDTNNIILGVPFYTRLWEIGEDFEDSTALRVASAEKFILENEILLNYDNASKQNYGEKNIDGITYKIWMEDKDSLRSRLDLVEKYNIKGIAIWALDYSTDVLWEEIRKK